MRMAFGLISILVTLGVIIMIMHYITLPNAQQAIKIKKETEATLGALTAEGVQDSKDSIVLEPVTKSGKFDSLMVRSIVPGGVMQMTYGLLRNDVIIGVNGMQFDIVANGDSELAEALIWEARGRQQPLMIVRQGIRLDLPWQPAPKQNNNGPGANAIPNETPADKTFKKESPLSRQVRIQTH